MPGASQGWMIAAGVFDIAMAAGHAMLPVVLSWDRTLKKTDPIARGQLRTLNVMAALSFLVVGLLYCYGASTVSTDPLGRGVLFATAGFWTVRALVEGPMFGIRHPVSMLLTAVFLAGALLHAVPAWP